MNEKIKQLRYYVFCIEYAKKRRSPSTLLLEEERVNVDFMQSILAEAALFIKGPLHNDVVQQEIVTSPYLPGTCIGQVCSQPVVTRPTPFAVYSLVFSCLYFNRNKTKKEQILDLFSRKI